MKHSYHFSHRHRPPWWPENEEWPPKRWKYMRGQPFFRRMGCFFILFNIVGFLVFAVVTGLVYGVLSRGLTPETPVFDLLLAAGVIFVSFVIGLSILGARSFRRMFNPLDELVDATSSVADGDYSVRVEERGPPGVRSLVQGFNSMTERLQVNDRQRRAMLADVSHELRTPITVIQGNVEGILDGMYPADETRLKSILEETQILSRLVDDLRTMALAESGSLQLKREPTTLTHLIQEAVASFELQAMEKGIDIQLSLSDVDEMNLDPLRIREVLNNILSNALRYTPRGGAIKVGLTAAGVGLESDALSGEAVSKRGVTVFIQDSGPGIESADLPYIFDRFYKSSDSGGMGLGLSIARYIVEAHGGKIWAESAAEQGTKISFMIPA